MVAGAGSMLVLQAYIAVKIVARIRTIRPIQFTESAEELQAFDFLIVPLFAGNTWDDRMTRFLHKKEKRREICH